MSINILHMYVIKYAFSYNLSTLIWLFSHWKKPRRLGEKIYFSVIAGNFKLVLQNPIAILHQSISSFQFTHCSVFLILSSFSEPFVPIFFIDILLSLAIVGLSWDKNSHWFNQHIFIECLLCAGRPSPSIIHLFILNTVHKCPIIEQACNNEIHKWLNEREAEWIKDCLVEQKNNISLPWSFSFLFCKQNQCWDAKLPKIKFCENTPWNHFWWAVSV